MLKRIHKSGLIIIIGFILLFIIWLTNNKVYAYTDAEIKELTNFTIVDSEPEDADVTINGKKLKATAQLTYVESSVEKLLYGSEGMTDIKFLTTDDSNDDEDWKVVQEIVKKWYRVGLYIAAAALLTTLIYMAVVMVIEGFNPKKMPRGARMYRSIKGTPDEQLRKQALFEQWVISVILVGLITVIINIVVNFTGVVSSLLAGYNLEENNILVYVTYTDDSEDDDDDIDEAYEDEEDTTTSTTTIKGFTFEANLESLLLFQTQYKWYYAAKNILFMIGGGIITLFKIFIHGIFIVRMFIIAGLTIVAPIVILVNAILKIGRRKGILRKWFLCFMFWALLKSVIGLIYYVLGASNVYVIEKMPLYMAVVALIEIGAIVGMIKLFGKYLKTIDEIEEEEQAMARGEAGSYSSQGRNRQNRPMDRRYMPNRGLRKMDEDDYDMICEKLKTEKDPNKFLNEYVEAQYGPLTNGEKTDVAKAMKVRKLHEKCPDVVEKIKAEGKKGWNVAFKNVFPYK